MVNMCLVSLRPYLHLLFISFISFVPPFPLSFDEDRVVSLHLAVLLQMLISCDALFGICNSDSTVSMSCALNWPLMLKNVV